MAAKKATSTAKTSKVKATTVSKKPKAATVSTADPVEPTTKTKVVTKKVSKMKNRTDFLSAKSPLVSATIAEFIGTFVLACVFVLVEGNPLYVGFGVIALTFAISLLSGAHLNPLVTLGAWATKKIDGARAGAFVFAQVLASIVAFGALRGFIDEAPEVDAQAAALGGTQAATTLFAVPDISALTEGHLAIFLGELLGATIFGFVVASVVRDRADRATTSLTIGFGLMLALVVASTTIGYATNAGATTILNPAVSLALQAIDWSNIQAQLWPILTYIVAPIIGGVIGFFAYDTLRIDDELVATEVK